MQIKDLSFTKFIEEERLLSRVRELADQINRDYEGKCPVLLPVLNGSFMFASDLIKDITLSCRLSFVKVSSYNGTNSTGQLKTLIGHEESLFNQDIIIIEDIVDNGLTISRILSELTGLGAKSVEVVSLLRKKVAREKNIEIRYVGFELEDQFVLGYGMDYDGLGRNLRDLYMKE
jgi:hypoxanthine phosphoribosyltransferase